MDALGSIQSIIKKPMRQRPSEVFVQNYYALVIKFIWRSILLLLHTLQKLQKLKSYE